MGALDGVKVVEAGLLVQAPQAAATLAEWGAEVIKIEQPGVGDHARWVTLAPDDDRSAYFTASNRGKRSITLDLRTEGGREVFLRLIATADVVMTNFTPGTMDSWGVGYEAVSAVNPRLVYAAGSTFGFVGAAAEREGTDLSAQAAAGLISTTGVDGADPTPVGATIADHIASQNMVAGILAALLVRERTGRGQCIETSLVGGQIWAQASEYTGVILSGRPLGRSNRSHPLIPGMYGIFPTADGWLAISGISGPDRVAFFELLGRPELETRFSEFHYWEADKAALFPLLDEVFVTATTDEWCARLRAAGLRYAPVSTHSQVLDDETMWENGYFATVDAASGPMTVPTNPVRFSDTPGRPPALAPELGQHTEEILLELGYGWDEITRLRDDGAT